MSDAPEAADTAVITAFALQTDAKGMKAYLQRVANVPLGRTGPEDVLNHLEAKGLLVDEDVQRIVAETLDAWRADPEDKGKVLLTEGVPPEKGQDGGLVWEPNCDPDRSPAGGEDGDFSHYETQLISVDAGSRIAPATAGKPGVTVFGKEVPPREGRPLQLKKLEGCHQEEKTGEIIADISGTLTRSPRGICVSQGVHIRHNVDFETGHVSSPGDVVVDGDVADLFRVTSGRNVTVRGAVNAAEIRANGDVAIAGALTNHHKGICLAGGNVSLRLVDNSVVAARGAIQIDRQAVGSDLLAGGAIQCPSGTINGGMLVGRGGIEVNTLGSGAGAAMLVVAGVDWILGVTAGPMAIRAKELDEEIQQRLPAIEVLKANMKRLTHHQREEVTELEFAVLDLATERDELLATAEAMRAESTQHSRPVVTVSRQVNSGVELRLGNRVTQIQSPIRGPVTFSLAKLDNVPTIVAKTGRGNALPLVTGKLAEPLEGVQLPEMPPEPVAADQADPAPSSAAS